MDPLQHQDTSLQVDARLRAPGWKVRALLLLASMLFAALIGEVGLRLFFSDMLSGGPDERSLLYRYDKDLGWFPIANSANRFTGSVSIMAAHNRNGFRDHDHVKSEKPRILVIGDSFVWGYDVEASDRFTDLLQARHPEWDIYNAGVSGYGTDQEFLLLQRRFDEFAPDVVLLIFCSETDHDDNTSNARYGGYYKPYYTLNASGKLQLGGVPVPKFEKAFYAAHKWLGKSYVVRLVVHAYCQWKAPAVLQLPDPTGEILLAMRRFVVERGAVFAVGIEAPYPSLERLLEQCRIPYASLAVGASEPDRFHTFGAHWTAQGHVFVSNLLDGFLSGLLKASKPKRADLPTESDEGRALAQYHKALTIFEDKNLTPKEAIAQYRAVLRQTPDFPGALNNLAWILSTSPDPACRDGTEAVRLAQKACDLTGHKRAEMLGTLAAAYAEAGRFPEAIAAGEKAGKLAAGDGNLGLKEKNDKLLALYREGKPYHGP